MNKGALKILAALALGGCAHAPGLEAPIVRDEGVVRLSVSESGDAIVIRTVTMRPWGASLVIDRNRDGVLNFGDVSYSHSIRTHPDGRAMEPEQIDACNSLVIDENEWSTCGQFESQATFVYVDHGGRIEITREIPKSEISSDGCVAVIVVEAFNEDTSENRQPVWIEYRFALE
jgi:hypothetical protein